MGLEFHKSSTSSLLREHSKNLVPKIHTHSSTNSLLSAYQPQDQYDLDFYGVHNTCEFILGSDIAILYSKN